jgi:hypothetical protein
VAFEWDVTINMVDRPKNETGLPTGNNCNICATELSGVFSLSDRGGAFGRGGPCSRRYHTNWGGVPFYCPDDTYCYGTGSPLPGGVKDPTNDSGTIWDPWGTTTTADACTQVVSQTVEASVYCSSDTEYTVEVAVTIVFWLQMEDQTFHSHLTNCAVETHEETEVLGGLVGFVNTFFWRRTIAIDDLDCDSLADFEVPYDSKTCRCLDDYPADPEYYICDPEIGPGPVYLNSV